MPSKPTKKKKKTKIQHRIDISINPKCPIKNLKNFIKVILKHSLEYIQETESIKGPFEISITVTDNQEIQKLNLTYRKKDDPTDVLSFSQLEGEFIPNHDYTILGDIVISFEKAIEQSKELQHSFYYEIQRLLVHGLYHLLQYDHERSKEDEELMNQKERELMTHLLNISEIKKYIHVSD
ncbi:MAG: rRNA maturation RNase YbeY [Leptospiraceae bacterium]|nr:rRNA maturation RNase YbeY [Leptospiraceae bacterium]MDW7975792.1 rRNA maturation RNase YbeY [Leptospiraceae bacterium]